MVGECPSTPHPGLILSPWQRQSYSYPCGAKEPKAGGALREGPGLEAVRVDMWGPRAARGPHLLPRGRSVPVA